MLILSSHLLLSLSFLVATLGLVQAAPLPEHETRHLHTRAESASTIVGRGIAMSQPVLERRDPDPADVGSESSRHYSRLERRNKRLAKSSPGRTTPKGPASTPPRRQSTFSGTVASVFNTVTKTPGVLEMATTLGTTWLANRPSRMYSGSNYGGGGVMGGYEGNMGYPEQGGYGGGF